MNPTIYRLSTIHSRIDREIRSEARRKVPDWIRLLRLKKLRLAIKDRITGHLAALRRR